MDLSLGEGKSVATICVPPFVLAFVVAGQFEYLLDANNAFLIFSFMP
jgi:hypothetical protein